MCSVTTSVRDDDAVMVEKEATVGKQVENGSIFQASATLYLRIPLG